VQLPTAGSAAEAPGTLDQIAEMIRELEGVRDPARRRWSSTPWSSVDLVEYLAR
jgi:hypothetical protein